MNLFSELRNVLLATNAVTAIVGTGDDARIWNSWPRTYQVPCLVMDVDQETEQNDISGHSGMVIADVTVTARGSTHDESDALADAVHDALEAYAGAFDAIHDDTQHSETPKGDGSTKHWYDHVLDFTMLWSR